MNRNSLERLDKEVESLELKIEDLEGFLQGDDHPLTNQEKRLLDLQLGFMNSYLNILKTRLTIVT